MPRLKQTKPLMAVTVRGGSISEARACHLDAIFVRCFQPGGLGFIKTPARQSSRQSQVEKVTKKKKSQTYKTAS